MVLFSVEKILNKTQSLESVGVFLVFTPISFRVEYILKLQVKFKYSLWENKSLTLSEEAVRHF